MHTLRHLSFIFVVLYVSLNNHLSRAAWHDETFEVTTENITTSDSTEPDTDYFDDTRSNKNGATRDEIIVMNDYEYDYDGGKNEKASKENDKHVIVRERKCMPLSECYFYNELLNHPSLPREVVDNELKIQQCGYEMVSEEHSGNTMFKHYVLMTMLFMTTYLSLPLPCLYL